MREDGILAHSLLAGRQVASLRGTGPPHLVGATKYGPLKPFECRPHAKLTADYG